METWLETERLVLRRFTVGDAELLVELDSDPEVMRFLTGQATPRDEIEQKVLPEILATYALRPGLGTFAAHTKAGGEFAGWFGLQPTREPAVVEVGYRLRRAVWGRGYATEGTRALVAKAFGELGVERVVAQTMAVNTGSRRVMAKAGLRFVRLWHEHFEDPLPGTEHGEVEYALDRATWLAGSRA
ncbi:GCN5-related N-acetyltransferase [Kribbella flavida DSM 17836]|uniref:GCN5-related N-acetyltransferase n=1 Tax=Kribbella flavida (strain DSM 17836 / JCM 10339 / NBRC 14399) TaxID=479435 RepID=D2PP19_KRIFD|nr:GNAT family N-acetyltransferase [Kribbella flavida]ADB32837.1 GCN5-related N-acetyltransferase [Kribbella flavida DSM 17836]